MEGIKTNSNLYELGIYVAGITYAESFGIAQQYHKNNSIPQEYKFDPVDERVDIYSHYSDELYDKFIEEGLKIHTKYNIDSKCNPKNERLVLYNESCQFDIDNAHGGYQCGKDGVWNKEKCVPIFCDIDYFYDRVQQKCVKECPLENKVFLLYKKDYSNQIRINKNETYEFYTVSRHDISYLFEASSDVLSYGPRISVFGDFSNIIINENKSSSDDINVNINVLTHDNNIFYLTLGDIQNLSDNTFYNLRKIFFIKLSADHIFYSHSLLDFQNQNVKIADIDDKITYKDIENKNESYFKDYSNEFIILKKDKSYVIDFDFKRTFDYINFYLCPINIDNNIKISENKINYLYLQKNKNYSLIIADNSIQRALKLSNKTLNSEIIIQNESFILNSENRFYIIDNNKTKINIEVKNEDALIELLYNLENIESIEIENIKNLNLNKKYYLITIPKEDKNKKFNFNIKRKTSSSYTVNKGYSLKNYYYYRYTTKENAIRATDFKFTIDDPYNDIIKLTKNEYYTILLEIFEGSLIVNLDIEQIDDNTKPKGKEGLSSWALAGIIVGSLIIVGIIVIIIIIFIRKRSKIRNLDIEEILDSKGMEE